MHRYDANCFFGPKLKLTNFHNRYTAESVCLLKLPPLLISVIISPPSGRSIVDGQKSGDFFVSPEPHLSSVLWFELTVRRGYHRCVQRPVCPHLEAIKETMQHFIAPCKVSKPGRYPTGGIQAGGQRQIPTLVSGGSGAEKLSGVDVEHWCTHVAIASAPKKAQANPFQGY